MLINVYFGLMQLLVQGSSVLTRMYTGQTRLLMGYCINLARIQRDSAYTLITVRYGTVVGAL